MAMYYGDSNGKAQRIVVTGMQGPAGQGVPVGGTAGQVLTKKSSANYDAEWSDLAPLGTKVQTVGSVDIYQNDNIITLVANQTITSAQTLNPYQVDLEQIATGIPYPPTFRQTRVIRIMNSNNGVVFTSGEIYETGTIYLNALYVGPDGSTGQAIIRENDILAQYIYTA